MILHSIHILSLFYPVLCSLQHAYTVCLCQHTHTDTNQKALPVLNGLRFLLGLCSESEQPYASAYASRAMVLLVCVCLYHTCIQACVSVSAIACACVHAPFRGGGLFLTPSYDSDSNTCWHPFFPLSSSLHPWGPSLAVLGVEICWLFPYHPLLNAFSIPPLQV